MSDGSKSVLQGQVSPPASASWLSGLVGGRTEEGIPRTRLNASVAAKFLAEEVMHTGTMLVSRMRMSSPHIRRRLRDEMVGVEDYYAARGWLADPMSFHRDPPELTGPRLARVMRGGVPFEHLTFNSGYEPRVSEPGRERWMGYDDNHTAHAWVMRHKNAERPWLVCVNGYRTGFASVDITAFRLEELHRRGLNVACYVLPLHGPRKVSTLSGDRFFRVGYLNTIHGSAQAVWDLRRLLSWVRRQGDAPVGVYGLSLGGYATALLAAFEPELACVIAGIPATDFVRIMKRYAPPDLVEYSHQLGIGWESIERLLSVVAPLKLPPAVPVERRYIFGGLVDRIVDPTHVRDLWLHWDKPRIAWYHGCHLSFNYEPEVKALLREAVWESELTAAGI